MKRIEQNKNSCAQILAAAMTEFSEKAYDGASVNTICEKNKLSKGRVYHYFKSKDEIFLACVEECFDRFSAYLLENIHFDNGDIRKTIGNYFSARYTFFMDFPELRNIFFIAKLNPPEHLTKKIDAIYAELEGINDKFVGGVLKYLPLRNGFSRVKAEDYLSAFETFFYAFFNEMLRKSDKKIDPRELLEDYGQAAMDLLLYGVAVSDEENCNEKMSS
ncbi:MAG: TetR/AcrR family transcriptional regulator [Oscillospiraceae bacterium]